MSPGQSRARVCGWVPSAGQVSPSASVGWGDTAFYTTGTPKLSRGGGWGIKIGGAGDGRRGDGRGQLEGSRGWRGRGCERASGRGTVPRYTRTSTQHVGGGCVARVRRGGWRFSLEDRSGCTALSRNRVCFFTPSISRSAPCFSDCIRRHGAAHQMTNKTHINESIWPADKCAMRLRSCMAEFFLGAHVFAAQWPILRLRGDP